ncbi:phage tail protein [Breoghania sp.]|uniref:phage tail protein n=1 Tax=Breoghania sp. TaxID=2065378 RepID=UPI002611F56F|nr:phage tail protein [Breoghania sp.]MDJ0931835.1 phage tail protein [Breoghania sp.]
MVAPSGIHLWAWDARPWPAFPSDTSVWADGDNWQLGHWLNGRLGGCGLDGLVRAILSDFEISVADVDVGTLAGSIDGFTIPSPTSARAILEQLATIFGFISADTGTALAFRSPLDHPQEMARGDLAEPSPEMALLSATRAQESKLPSEIRLSFTDPTRDYARLAIASRRFAGLSRRVSDIDLNVAADAGMMQVAAEARLRDAWAGRERYAFALSETGLAIEPGDLVTLDGALIRITQI